MTWILANLGLVGELAVEHLRQCIVPIVLGLVISVPLGWLAQRLPWTRGVVLVVTSLLYTIPSVALFALLPPLLRISYLSELNLTIALTVYAVSLLVRSVVDGLDAVPADVRLSATAVGFGDARRFWTVELPLAFPVILAGLRVAAVSTISLATVGVLIGVRNLGYLFTDGYERRIIGEIAIGIVAVVLLALLIDLALRLAGRLAMPWTAVAARTRAEAAS